MIQGFLRVAAATPECVVGDCGNNAGSIISLIHEAAGAGARLAVFPELSITAYTCGDLFSQELLGKVSITAVRLIAESTRELPITSIIGFPMNFRNSRYNCAAVISRGKIHGIIPKTYLPNYGEFYEKRHFSPAPKAMFTIPAGVFGNDPVPFGTNILFTDEKNADMSFAVEICEDLWAPVPPSSAHVQAGAVIIANLSASNEIVGKSDYRRNLVAGQSAKGMCAYVYANAGHGESTTDMVFSGHNLIAENGIILAESVLFSTGLICTDIDITRLLQERRRMQLVSNEEGSGCGGQYVRIPLALDNSAAPQKSSVIHAGDNTNTVPAESSPTAVTTIPLFQTGRSLLRKIDPLPFVPGNPEETARRCEEIIALQTVALAKRLSHTNSKTAVIGISGGVDSTLAFLITVRAFDCLGLPRTGIQAITMPGFGTTKQTRGNAVQLAEILGTSVSEIWIHKAVKQHFEDIGQNPEVFDITYENAQARERTQILMDKANQSGGLVIGTGDLSELALGWSTYNGDHMSMYGVNSSIPKTLIRHILAYCAENPDFFVDPPEAAGNKKYGRPVKADKALMKSSYKEFSSILQSILDTPVSPELLPPRNNEISQKTEHIIGPYELHDFFLYYVTRWGFSPSRILFLAEQAFTAENTRLAKTYTRPEILKWMKVFYERFFSSQFKRSCMPDGPKVGSVALSPRGDWRMPSDASISVWLKEVEKLEE
ncbi:NAD(+) synthase [Brucepastera parasyntrophica]|uniref:NAD(+) synthase n=1 Tax=Brucepastera parasyntrophica TaxID=2880008 RepID=UPI00210A22E9|nr:NAD(+) synthase [Brucepastera parasyntrophica]ULQ59455.1 NAD(+) synthase [Brucepastera parasyntrophica]